MGLANFRFRTARRSQLRLSHAGRIEEEGSKCRMPLCQTSNSYMGPEAGIRGVFLMAPCILSFEDIDPLVIASIDSHHSRLADPYLRSTLPYDPTSLMKSMDLKGTMGFSMVTSTNHLDRLDPGIAKPPSTFDRRYLFDVPTGDERIQYCEYWRNKFRNNEAIDFPKEMKAKIADITGDFLFA